MVVEVHEKRICEINLLHIETLECILIVIFKLHNIGQWVVWIVNGRCELPMTGMHCQWQVHIVDGGYGLLMGGAGLVVG